MKSENMISAIGFRPVIAAPMAAPRMACSEIGVSRTRSGPNCSVEPTVALKHAARLGDVLAEEHDVVVARHFLRDAAGDRVAIADFCMQKLRHAQPPSA